MCPLPTRMILDLWSPRDLWVDHLLKSWGRYQEMHFCSCLSRFFSFSPPPVTEVSPQKSGVGEEQCCSPQCQADFHLLLLLSLLEKLLPPPHHNSLASIASTEVQTANWLSLHKWMDLWGILVCCTRTFCSVTDVQLVVNWRGKKIRMIYAATMLSQILNHNF